LFRFYTPAKAACNPVILNVVMDDSLNTCEIQFCCINVITAISDEKKKGYEYLLSRFIIKKLLALFTKKKIA